MANPTFNAGIDYFGLVSGTSNALKVTGSNENRSIQSTNGPNLYGDAAVVDSWGETAAPSSDYQIVADLANTLASPKFTLGSIIAAGSSNISIGGSAVPVALGSVTINTQTGSAPTLSASGQALFSGAAALRYYILPAFTLTPRHRAQDFLGLCTIKKGANAADPATEYGLESVNATFPIEFTLAQPKGALVGYDLHGGTVTVDYSMNWYASTDPTIVLASSVTLGLSGNGGTTTTVAPAMSNPVAKACPEGGYTQYAWQVSFPLIGYEAPVSSS